MKFLCLSILVASASAFAPASSNTRAATQLYGEYGASSTSFYTTTEKQDSYASLDDILQEKCKDEKVREVIVDMLEVCADITEALRTALVTVEDTSNEFGDTQLSVDVSEHSRNNISANREELYWNTTRSTSILLNMQLIASCLDLTNS